MSHNEEIEQIENQVASPERQEVLIDLVNDDNQKKPALWLLIGLIGLAVLVGAGILYYFNTSEATHTRIYDFTASLFTREVLFYICVGLAAQMVDGALGMAYGATSTSLLLGLGIPPAIASASVHVAEVFTTGASGISHFRFGNVNKKLFMGLLIPGVIGAITGAFLLSKVIDGDVIKPYMSAYLLILGLVVLRKAFQKKKVKSKTKRLGLLALFGGFMDAIGGGGWGPVVTSTLLSKGRSAHYTIGSVNAAEFFISLAGASTFLLFGAITGWPVIIGLIIGGVIASPFAALLVRKIKRKPLMIMVGILIILTSLRTIIMASLHH
ncbi:sulfite exporter TauE/SafE family protein [Chitinophaga sancti]|uniref:sulfite exporter TauE/SafE family protein n=1 Tax=Chitinophaga sancti TaxID=1004 RepID=UPI002A7609D3|nr:sulfite exporter TauE/SafE family protein [Chitinophaga sancti]WPQ63784.1 sulfite exporter TauE/SafE family protein [Chitinophaga sancti]